MPLMALTFSNCTAQRKSRAMQRPKTQTIESAAVVDTFKADKNKKGDKIPEMTLKTWDDKTITTKDLVANQPILFVLFNPGCGHCKDIMLNVKKNLGMFKNTNIVFVAGTPLQEQLPSFVKAMELIEVKEMMVAGDVSGIIEQTFEYNGIPQIMLYDKNHKLQHIYYSEASLAEMSSKLYGK